LTNSRAPEESLENLKCLVSSWPSSFIKVGILSERETSIPTINELLIQFTPFLLGEELDRGYSL